MNGNTAVAMRGPGRMGAMVRSATSIYTYWHGIQPEALRVVDLSGRPRAERLDGTGERLILLAPGQSDAYVNDLLPGRLYCVELGVLEDGRFEPSLGTTPVQTPWLRGEDAPTFPAPYHRS